MCEVDLETIVSLAKRRGFIFPSSDIYGGLAGFYDYGPYGALMVRKIKNAWWDRFVRQTPNIFEIDSAIIQNPKLWEASGHVDGFIDPLVECENCHTRFRADQVDVKKACPNCDKKGKFSSPRTFNLMLKTNIGAVEDESSKAYLRPETAGGMFTNYELVRETTRSKLPFGIAQIGKAFRNEISPRDFIFRVRELEQMEMQYFVNPANDKQEFENLKEINWKFLTDTLGIDKKNLRWHEHDDNERAHYAKAAFDIEFNFPFGFKELWGTHHRSDFDLKAHMKKSGKDLSYFDDKTAARFVPYVMESSVGVGRLMLAALTNAYHEEQVKGETRVVLRLAKSIAPIDVAVLPLSNKPELTKLAKQIYGDLVKQSNLFVDYDETQSIGKRYRRQDEIGTPKCVTVDFDSLKDGKVTIRDRDSMEQVRANIKDIGDQLHG